MKYYCFLLLFVVLQTTQVFAVSNEFKHKLAVAAFIESRGLQLESNFSSYYNQIRTQALSTQEGTHYFQAYLKLFRSDEFKEEEKMHNLYLELAYGGGLKDAAIVYLLVKQDKDAKDLVGEIKDQFLSQADSMRFYDSTIENYSRKNSKTLPTGSTIGIAPNVLLTYSQMTAPGRINLEAFDYRHVETLKHCFRQLMQEYRFPDCTITLSKTSNQTEDKGNYSPLHFYMSLKGQTLTSGNYYFGGFFPSGRLRIWGHMPDYYKSLEGNKDKVVFIPAADIDGLRDSVLLYGHEIMAQNNFIGVTTLKDIEDQKIGESVSLYNEFKKKLASRQFKSTNDIMAALNNILKVNPGHFSALLYRELLMKKFRPKVTLMNSYFEFEDVYKKFSALDLLNHLRESPVSDEKLEEINSKIIALEKVCHPEMRSMCKQVIELIDIYKETRKEVVRKSEPNIQNGIMKYYKSLREVNLQRDMLIDSRKALDRIFVR